MMNMPRTGAVGERAADGGPVQPAKLFIGGITRHTTTKQLRDHFSRYGRVLDCVAMRQPDGRPRGFGYVTLDSPLAADRCLAETQIIDSRVVDMKRAVPEGSGNPGSPMHGAPPSMMDPCMGMTVRSPHSVLYPPVCYAGAPHLGGMMMPDMSPPSPADWAWAGQHSQQKASCDVLDCVELLSRRAMGGLSPPQVPPAPPLLCEARVASEGYRALFGVGSPQHGEPASLPVESAPPGLLSPSAPVFVPMEARQPMTRPAPGLLSPSSPARVDTTKAKLAGQRRTALGDVTNLVSNSGEIFKEAAAGKLPMKAGLGATRPAPGLGGAAGGLGLIGSENMPPALVATGELKSIMKERPAAALPLDIKEDSECSQAGEDDECEIPAEQEKRSTSVEAPAAVAEAGAQTTTTPEKKAATTPEGLDLATDAVAAPPSPASSTSDGNESCDGDEEEAMEAFEGPLPSIGSAEHAAGTCRRCNFFPKGRCQNGQNCSFCHLPHDKRKPSRQEKRERRAAWLALHDLPAEGDEELDSDADVQQTLAYSVFPGMPPIRATKLPAPLSLPGCSVEASAATPPSGYPRLPPGLPPPPPQLWQPEEEVSPVPYGMQFYTQPPVTAQPILATVPSVTRHVASAPQSLAPTPKAGMAQVAASFGLTNQTAALLAAPNTAPPTPSGEATVMMLPKESCTIATQTTIGTQTDDADGVEASDEEECGVDQVGEDMVGNKNTKTKHSGRTWIREELLRFREPARVAASEESAEGEKGGAGALFTVPCAAAEVADVADSVEES
jgi:hypothetical protein